MIKTYKQNINDDSSFGVRENLITIKFIKILYKQVTLKKSNTTIYLCHLQSEFHRRRLKIPVILMALKMELNQVLVNTNNKTC